MSRTRRHIDFQERPRHSTMVLTWLGLGEYHDFHDPRSAAQNGRDHGTQSYVHDAPLGIGNKSRG